MKKLLFLLILLFQGNLNAAKADWPAISFGVVCLSGGTISLTKWLYNYIKCKNLERDIKANGAKIIDEVWNDNTFAYKRIIHYIHVTIPKNCSLETRKYLENSEHELVSLYSKTKTNGINDFLAWVSIEAFFVLLGGAFLLDEINKYQINA
jgi:hypothetical protein